MNSIDTRHIAVVTLFPEMFEAISCGGITARAIRDRRVQVEICNPRDYAQDKHRTVDDRPYGGGPGMVMMVQPLRDAVRDLKRRLQATLPSAAKPRTIYLSPQGRILDQNALREMSLLPGLILVAGRYEGVDERFIEAEIDEEWSIGDYVLSGGELAAMVIIDGITRLLPGALGDQDSAQQDSFVDGLLDYPHFTRPERLDGRAVPPVLLSGDHQAIARWRAKQALGRTWLRRPDLLRRLQLTDYQKKLLEEFIGEQ